MNKPVQITQQSGVALIVGLLILFILTVLGISAYSNANVQERSASNSNLQSLAFEVAAAGASNAIQFFDTHRTAGDDEACGETGHTGWADPTPWVDTEMFNGVQLSQRMYCLADEYPCVAGDPDCPAGGMVRPPRSQLFVLSRGKHPAGSARYVEVRLTVGKSGGGAGDGCGALCLPGCDLDDVAMPTSGAFYVFGEDGPAVTTGCDGMRDAIIDDIQRQKRDNYEGGIHTSEPGAPWNSPTLVDDFRETLKQAAMAAEAAGTCQTGCYFDGADLPEGVLIDNGNSTYGDFDPDTMTGDPQITYIDGDIDFGGNITGAGILVVDGDLTWNGTPQFEGLIIVLGGSYIVDGGGTGGDHAGSVVILNTHDNPVVGSDSLFGPSLFDISGGGTADYNYDCATLKFMRDSLLGGTLGYDQWNPECNELPETVFQAGPPEIVIASWRENIGWRDEMIED